MIATLAWLLSITSLSWLGWVAPAAHAGRHLSGRAGRAVISAAPAALATTITVNSTADGTLPVLAANATCDLREAVQAANTNAVVGQCPAGMTGADTIIFAPNVSGTIGLTAGELVPSEALTLNFDGVSYNRAPRRLAASSIPARADDNDTLLIVNRFGGNLAVGAATLSNLLPGQLSAGCSSRNPAAAPLSYRQASLF